MSRHERTKRKVCCSHCGLRAVLVCLLSVVMLLALCGCEASDYAEASRMMQQERWKEAAVLFEALGDYSDSAEKAKQCKIGYARGLVEMHFFDEAQALLEEVGEFEDAPKLLATMGWYKLAYRLQEKGQLFFKDPIVGFEVTMKYREEMDAIEASYSFVRDAGLQMQLKATFAAGIAEAVVEGTSTLAVQSATLEDFGTGKWNISAYQSGDSLIWDEYSVSGQKVNGTPLGSDPTGLCGNAEIPLRNLTDGMRAILSEQEDLDVTMRDLGFTSYS